MPRGCVDLGRDRGGTVTEIPGLRLTPAVRGHGYPCKVAFMVISMVHIASVFEGACPDMDAQRGVCFHCLPRNQNVGCIYFSA